MAFLDRLFGFVDDATAGGKDYDALSAGAIPDADTFYPVTGGNWEPNVERIDRNDEVRGRRANVPPRSFRAAPTMTIPVSCYRSIFEKIAYKCMGQVNTTGAGPYTHTVTTLGYPTVDLPALHAQMIRDTLNIKMSGATVNRFTADFPLDGEGTIEFELFGKFFNEFAAAAPTADYTDYGATVDTLMLRDASFYIDDSATKVQDLQGFSLTFNNNLIRKWYAGRNVVARGLGSPTSTHKLWFPAENKAQAAPDITYSVTFGNTDDAQEIASWFAQIQKFEFNLVGLPITGGTEEVTITLWQTVNTDGGAGDLSARDDITSTFEGGVFWDEVNARDIEIEFISDVAVLD